MPHVDEGTLHALLDGALRAEEPAHADAVEAHLAACADCRALLDDAIAVRGRSGEVLAMLEPTVAAPDFEEVLVRAGRRTVSRPGRLARQARWTRGLAWAATITIALGTGYLIRDRLVPERAAQAREAPPTTLEGARTPAEARPDAVANVESAAATGAVADDAASLEASRERTLPPPVATGAAAVAFDAAPEPRMELPERRERMRAAESPDLTRLAPVSVSAASAGPRVVSAVEAAERLGAPLLVLPGAEVAQVTAGTDAEGAVVVSVQRLPEDVEIRVTQRAAAILPESVATEEAAARAPLGEPLSQPPAPVARFAPASAAERILELQSVSAPTGTEAAAGSDAVMNSVRVRVNGAELVLEGPLPSEVLRLLAVGASPYQARP